MDELEKLLAQKEQGLPESERLASQAHRAQLVGELEKAAKLFCQAIEVSENRAPLHRDVAVVYLSNSQPQEAVCHLLQALALTPDLLQARGIHRALAEAYQLLGDQEKAQQHYRVFQLADDQAMDQARNQD